MCILSVVLKANGNAVFAVRGAKDQRGTPACLLSVVLKANEVRQCFAVRGTEKQRYSSRWFAVPDAEGQRGAAAWSLSVVLKSSEPLHYGYCLWC